MFEIDEEAYTLQSSLMLNSPFAKTERLPTAASLAAEALKLNEQVLLAAPGAVNQKSFLVQSKPGTGRKAPVGLPAAFSRR